jgi:hypothetical protein
MRNLAIGGLVGVFFLILGGGLIVKNWRAWAESDWPVLAIIALAVLAAICICGIIVLVLVFSERNTRQAIIDVADGPATSTSTTQQPAVADRDHHTVVLKDRSGALVRVSLPPGVELPNLTAGVGSPAEQLMRGFLAWLVSPLVKRQPVVDAPSWEVLQAEGAMVPAQRAVQAAVQVAQVAAQATQDPAQLAEGMRQEDTRHDGAPTPGGTGRNEVGMEVPGTPQLAPARAVSLYEFMRWGYGHGDLRWRTWEARGMRRAAYDSYMGILEGAELVERAHKTAPARLKGTLDEACAKVQGALQIRL